VKVEKEELGDGRPSQIREIVAAGTQSKIGSYYYYYYPRALLAVIGMFRILKSNWKWGSILK
jgi:hypothetical protein